MAVEILRRALWAWTVSAILVAGFVLLVGALSPDRWEVRGHGRTAATVADLQQVLWQPAMWEERRGELIRWEETTAGIEAAFLQGDREERLWLSREPGGARVRSQLGEVSIHGQVVFEDTGPLRTVTWTREGAVHQGVLARFAARFARGRAEIAVGTAVEELIARAEGLDAPTVPTVATVRVTTETWPCPEDGSCAVGRVIQPMEAAGTDLRLLERVEPGLLRCVQLPDELAPVEAVAIIECPPS